MLDPVQEGMEGNPSGLKASGGAARLKAFFSYFGAKVSLAAKYPAPEFGTLIEPFAGSAGYACSHWDREVFLYDKNPTVVGVWNFLIRATYADIISLPLDPVAVSALSQPERDFIGLWWGRCLAAPASNPVPWMRTGRYPYSFWSEQTRARIAGQVGCIKHWRCEVADYADIPNRAATWFIDPPYQARGKRYPFGSAQMDYAALAAWVRSREGQVIACESDAADYLPFRPAYDLSTVKYRREKRTVPELVYTARSAPAQPGSPSSPSSPNNPGAPNAK